MMKGLLISKGWVRGLHNPIADLNRDAGGKSARGGPHRCQAEYAASAPGRRRKAVPAPDTHYNPNSIKYYDE